MWITMAFCTRHLQWIMQHWNGGEGVRPWCVLSCQQFCQRLYVKYTVWYTAMKYYIVIAIKINCFLCLYYLLVCLFLKVYNNSPVKVHIFVLYLQEKNIFNEMNKHWTQCIKSGKTFYEVFLLLLIWSTAGMCLHVFCPYAFTSVLLFVFGFVRPYFKHTFTVSLIRQSCGLTGFAYMNKSSRLHKRKTILWLMNESLKLKTK